MLGPPSCQETSGSIPPDDAPPDDEEKRRILDALDKHAGNQTRAAKSLGITRRALIVRLERYGIARPRR
jgi:transcriptional regulator with GAF, ATPase, and Fis domain